MKKGTNAIGELSKYSLDWLETLLVPRTAINGIDLDMTAIVDYDDSQIDSLTSNGQHVFRDQCLR